MSLLLAIGCTDPRLQPSAVVLDQPQVRALAADTDLIASVDVPRLLGHPALATRIRDSPVFGIPDGAHGLDQVVLGCTSSGCVALVEGDVDQAGFGTLQGPSERLTTSSGWKGRLDRLGEGKLIVGDRAAVHELRRVHRESGPRFAGTWTEGLVPAGALWLAAREPAASIHRLQDAGGWGLEPLLASLQQNQAALDGLHQHVQALGMALEPSRERVVLRLRARSLPSALTLENALRVRRIDGLTHKQVVRHETTVEVVGSLDLEVLP